MHRLANVEGTTISVTSAMAPKDAKKAMERAQNFIKKEKWDHAQKELPEGRADLPQVCRCLGGTRARSGAS